MRQLISQIMLLVLLLSSLTAEAQNIDVTPASAQAMGSAVVSLAGGEYSAVNPASAANAPTTFGINANNRFGLLPLSTTSLMALLSVKNTQLITHFSHFGNTGYQENLSELGLARCLSPNWHMGLSFRYYLLASPELMRNPQYLSLNYGVQYQSKSWGVGLSLANPFGASFHDEYVHTHYPSTIRLGVHRQFQQLTASSQLTCLDFQRLSLQVGLQYVLLREIILRLGFLSQSSSLSLGISWVKRKFQFDYSFAYHQYLGFSPSFALYFRPKG